MILTNEQKERLMHVDPAQMGHYISSGYMSPKIKPIFQSAKIAGPAVTVRIAGDDNAMLYYAIEHAEPGSVIVVDRGGDEIRACCGDMVATEAKMQGMEGIVVDGMATDTVGITNLKFPVFCKGISAFTTRVQGKEGSYNIPIQCGGTVVNPGDIIFGDVDGVIVFPYERCDELLDIAEGANALEKERKAGMTQGKKYSDYKPVINTVLEQS